MSGYSRKIGYNALQSRDSATFNGTYQTLGSALSSSVVIAKIVNNSNQLVTISTDGSTDMDVYPSTTGGVFDVEANMVPVAGELKFPVGTQFYVKGPAGVGLVYLVTLSIL